LPAFTYDDKEIRFGRTGSRRGQPRESVPISPLTRSGLSRSITKEDAVRGSRMDQRRQMASDAPKVLLGAGRTYCQTGRGRRPENCRGWTRCERQVKVESDPTPRTPVQTHVLARDAWRRFASFTRRWRRSSDGSGAQTQGIFFLCAMTWRFTSACRPRTAGSCGLRISGRWIRLEISRRDGWIS